MTASPAGETRHGTAVSVAGRGLLLIGRAGAGKSRLALEMIGLGAGLVADDQVRLSRRGTHVVMTAPEPIRGMIEARGLGLIGCPSVGPTRLSVVLDLDRTETERLPEPSHISVLGARYPLIGRPPDGHSASVLMLYLTHGRRA